MTASIGDYFDIPYSGEVPRHFPGDNVRILINGDLIPATITAIVNRVGQLSYDVDTDLLGPTWVFSEQVVTLS